MPAPSAPDYVDPKTCEPCHRQIFQDYSRTGMGRSFFRPAAADPAEDYFGAKDVYHDLSDTHFAMERRDGQYFQRRWQIGFDGKETNVEELKVDYVMGSGNHARSYLHRTAQGTLIELPLGWYPEQIVSTGGSPGPGHWAMSPGSDSPHPRTRRFVAYKCMFCHNAFPQIPAANREPGSDPVFVGTLPEGIDCQRCHGPGGRHLRAVRNRASTQKDVRASIVNPARLDFKGRMEVCMQCHLETSSGRIPASLVRFDRAPFSYVAGEPLDAFMLSFDHAPGTGHKDKFEAVNSVYRLRQSKCFLKSAGALTCETCHNPHRTPRGAEAVTHFAAVCRQCHAQIDSLTASGAHPTSPDCVECHMPKRRAEDTPGMIMTDHLIQRGPPTRNLLAAFREAEPENYKGRVGPYYPSPLPATAENALYLAVAQLGLKNNPVEGLQSLARETARQKPRNAEFYVVLGDGWEDAGRHAEAIAAYEQAAALSPRSVHTLRSLAAGYAAANRPAEAAAAFRRALDAAPGDAYTWYRYGMLDLAWGHGADALEKVRKAITLDPSLPDQSRSLAEILLSLNRRGEAESALSEALRTDPYDAGAWDLRARMLTEKGLSDEAIFSFERAIRLEPTNAVHLYDYALALVRMNRFADAQERADAAARANPSMAEAHELLGALFEQKRDTARAAEEYRRALQLRPGSDAAQQGLRRTGAPQ